MRISTNATTTRQNRRLTSAPAKQELKLTLRQWRTNTGIDESGAAACIEVKRKSIVNWENGSCSPRVEHLSKIVSCYKTGKARMKLLAKLYLRSKGINRSDLPLGYELTRLRIMRGIHQDALAADLGVSGKDLVSMWENEIKHPEPGNLHKIAAYYGKKITYLVKLYLKAEEMDPAKTPFGYRLAFLRVTKGVTVERVALDLKITKRPSNWEKERYYPKIEHFAQIARYYNTTVGSLALYYLASKKVSRSTTPLGYVLIYLRILKGVTLDTAASNLNASGPSTVSMWENEKKIPSDEQLALIANYYASAKNYETILRTLIALAAKARELRQQRNVA